MTLGLILLVVGVVSFWRAQAAARRTARTLAGYALEEGEQLADLAERLNRHGFELQHTASVVLPRLAQGYALLQRPMVAAALPWILRRLFMRPLKRRG